MMPIFSFRAECMHDVEELRQALRYAGVSHTIRQQRTPCFDNDDLYVGVELEAKRQTLESMRELIQSVEDGEAMVSSLRECRLADNSFAAASNAGAAQ